MNILVTGGCGFIGSRMIHYLIHETSHQVINVDSLTYAGSLQNVKSIQSHSRYQFYRKDIRDAKAMLGVLQDHAIDAVLHFAAETHVDRSIASGPAFIETNVVGTQTLLEAVKKYLQERGSSRSGEDFRWLQVSTDEVFGDRGADGRPSVEGDPYSPSSPYSASKAAADHLVRAYERTYGIPSIITYASNNYGPDQHPEKLIPLTVERSLAGKAIPIYGGGKQVREWIYVEDHVLGIYKALVSGSPGQSYNLGSGNQMTNIDLVQRICRILDELDIEGDIGRTLGSYADLIAHVDDRPGHDFRYAIDSTKAKRELDWEATTAFQFGLKQTAFELVKRRRIKPLDISREVVSL